MSIEATSPKALEELLYQLLETELGRLDVFRAARKAAMCDDLRSAWDHFLTETAHSFATCREVLEVIGLDPCREVKARAPVRHLAAALIRSIDEAAAAGDLYAAEIVAAEAVAAIAIRHKRAWALLATVARGLYGRDGAFVREACDLVIPQAERELAFALGTVHWLRVESLGISDRLADHDGGSDRGAIVRLSRSSAAAES